MPLNLPLVVQYQGSDSLLTTSPVFDSINLPIEAQGKLVGQTGISFITFFLVYKTNARKKIMWINIENCDIVDTAVGMLDHNLPD